MIEAGLAGEGQESCDPIVLTKVYMGALLDTSWQRQSRKFLN